jgi:hypothetical protein
MAAQHVIAPPPPAASASISLPSGFEIKSQDRRLKGEEGSKTLAASPYDSPQPLGVISNFVGVYAGTGFNTIFRPNSGQTTSALPNQPLQLGGKPNDNVLELNLTQETLSFAQNLGSVPNRGLGAQTDIFLNGVPYLQSIHDVSNQATGQANGCPSAIHLEPGLWMHVPATTEDPVVGESLCRMGSIPHGTTINAQCLQPTTSFPGPPDFINKIPPVDITPFVTGSNPENKITFASQDVTNKFSARLPQDLTKFITAGTITQDILNNPNLVLAKAIQGQDITKTIVFTVATTPTAPELGGGVANIGFLQGATTGPVTGPNANATQMTATFWIETVQHTIEIPVFKLGSPPLRIKPQPTSAGAYCPTFVVHPPRDIPEPISINVTSTQIQYQQTVFLVFAGLTWPHVSVATLYQQSDIPVPLTDF